MGHIIFEVHIVYILDFGWLLETVAPPGWSMMVCFHCILGVSGACGFYVIRGLGWKFFCYFFSSCLLWVVFTLGSGARAMYVFLFVTVARACLQHLIACQLPIVCVHKTQVCMGMCTLRGVSHLSLCTLHLSPFTFQLSPFTFQL